MRMLRATRACSATHQRNTPTQPPHAAFTNRLLGRHVTTHTHVMTQWVEHARALTLNKRVSPY
eukprot:453679-Prorocentrum_minimum.AAC.1